MTNKRDLINDVATRTGLNKHESEEAVNSLLNSISRHLANSESVQIVGFGTFEIHERVAHLGRNPVTGESIMLPAKALPKFRPGKTLKDAIKD